MQKAPSAKQTPTANNPKTTTTTQTQLKNAILALSVCLVSLFVALGIFVGINMQRRNLLTLSPITAPNSTKPLTRDERLEKMFEFEYDEMEKAFKITRVKTTDNDIQIPSTYLDLNVVSLASTSFYKKSSTKRVTFEETSNIQNLEGRTFERSGLMSIIIPSSVTRVGAELFYKCRALQSVTLLGDKLPAAEEGAESLNSDLATNQYAYWNPLVFISKTATEQSGSEAAIWGKFTENVIKYDHIDGEFLIANQNNANTNMPSGYYVVGYTGIISDITLPATTQVDGEARTIIGIGEIAFIETAISSVFIPKTYETIGENAFASYIDMVKQLSQSISFTTRSKLTSVTFEQGSQLQYINSGAFYSARMNTITIPKMVKEIGSNAFTFCTKLTTVDFETDSRLETISNNAFSSSAITSFHIPAITSSIGNNVFEECSSLAEITCDSGNQYFTVVGKCLIQTTDGILLVALKNFSLPTDGSIKRIANGAFSISRPSSLYLPSGVTVIDSFNGAKYLTYIDLPSTVTSLGSWCFANCTSGLTVVIRATTPPSTSYNPFYNTFSPVIRVPSSALSTYRSKWSWASSYLRAI